jgi:exodeoxyribonuclease V alpha subunit
VLADLLASGQFPVTTLTHIFRQGAGSGIAANARRVNAGELPRFGREVQDCFFVPAEQPAAAADMVVDLVARRLPKAYGFGPVMASDRARCRCALNAGSRSSSIRPCSPSPPA